MGGEGENRPPPPHPHQTTPFPRDTLQRSHLGIAESIYLIREANLGNIKSKHLKKYESNLSSVNTRHTHVKAITTSVAVLGALMLMLLKQFTRKTTVLFTFITNKN